MTHRPYTTKELTDESAKPVEVPRKIERKIIYETLQPYFPDPELVKAVNIALLLDRPLLVMGEPGCGKSLLANDVAFTWYKKQMYTLNKYFVWNIKSTSKAREGLYEIDHLQRLRDANMRLKKIDTWDNYIKYGPLDQAMLNSTTAGKAVLLIDEIDKADIDFSNDLLNELERNSYIISEIKKTKIYPEKPFVVITSNSEKDLSDAFLRRCVFHFIDLFSNDKLKTKEPFDWLKRIITARYYSGGKKETDIINTARKKDEAMIDMAIEAFIAVRKKMNADMLTYRKTVSTSEFLDWFSVLKKCKDNPSLAGSMSLNNEFTAWLNKTSGPLPFGNALFKTTRSLLDLQKLSEKS